MPQQYYKLTGRPFQLTPDPKFYFESATHRKAMSYLGYGLAQGEGFIVITGDIGAGKTTLVGHLMATIDPQRLTAVKIASDQIDSEGVLRLAAHAFGISTENVDRAHVLSRIEAFMHHQARAGRRSLLIVDEAQSLGFDALEALRMLSNFQLGGQSLVQIFLLGQPEFREAVNTPPLEQLRQRIIATHHLEPMQASEVQPYIEHRLKVVGWTGNPVFEPGVFEAMAEASGGVPRQLNALATRVLERGARDQQSCISCALVDQVRTEMGEEFTPRAKAPEPAPVKVATAASRRSAENAELIADARALSEGRQSLRAEVHSLRASIERAPTGQDDMADAAFLAEPDRLTRLEMRLGRIEQRLEEQEEMLRRILSTLVEWIDQEEPEDDQMAHRAA